jgi:hypothetical protein
MSKLCLYAIFHGNLNFSYIPKDLYPQILDRCYWPLLQIVEEQKAPLGLEFSGYTLEVINSLDPTFVQRLRDLWREGACEFIGSGYVQAIMPLIPSRVNRENLHYGNAVYERLLGRRPTMAFVNEQVYSAGLPRIYEEAGYESLVVNWDSALPAHSHPELLYRPCAILVGGYGRMPVLWHCTGAYREFQKYIERETSLDNYLAWLLSHVPGEGERSFPLYSSDWEVFDFKPWQPYPDGFPLPELGEMERVAGLVALLKRHEDIEFVLPSSLTTRFPDQPLVQLESCNNPLPFKKQDQHGMLRWAVGGRDAVRFNTQCHQLYQHLLLGDLYARRQPDSAALRQEGEHLWQELCFLWNSDFRTFTTEEKHLQFRNRMGAALDRAARMIEGLQLGMAAPGEVLLTNCSPVSAESEPVSFTIPANGTSPGHQVAYELQLDGQRVPCQVTHSVAVGDDARTLTLEAIPVITASQAGVGTIREVVAPPYEARAYRIDVQEHLVETPAVHLRLLPQLGGGINTLAFPQVSGEPLIRWRRQDAFPTPASTPGLVPGDLVLQDQLGRSVTDHHPTELLYPRPDQSHEIFVPVRCRMQTELGTIWKTYRVYLHQPRVDLIVRFQWRDVVPAFFRLGRMALNPRAFDRGTLHYATTNGGEDIERFSLSGQKVGQDEPMGPEVSARGCLGATEGWVVVGDAERGLGFVTRPGQLYSVPMVHYEESEVDPEGFLMTLSYSLGEQDETSHTLWRGHSMWSLSILGGRDDIIAQTRTSALLANGGLLATSEINRGFE